MSPFQDSKEGSTHFFGDNCGMPEHNINLEKWEKEFDEKFSVHKGEIEDDYIDCKLSKYIKSFISSLLQAKKDQIKSDLLAIADAGELEDLRREVEAYFSKLNNLDKPL